MSLKKIAPFMRRDLFGGTGSVNIWNLIGGRATPPFSAVLWCELSPYGSVGRHRQQDDPEIVICIEGHGEAMVGKSAFELVPGSVVHLPLGQPLALKNNSDKPLRYLIIKARQTAQ